MLLCSSLFLLSSFYSFVFFFFSSRRRHTSGALVTGVQTCALPICRRVDWRIVKARAPSANAQTPAAMTRTLVIRYDPAHAEIARYFAAAAKAWNAADEASVANASKPPLAIDSAGTDTVLPADSDWLLRSEEHTSELQSLMRISYAVFC